MLEPHAVVLEDMLPLSLEMGDLETARRGRLMLDNMALLKALLVMDDHLLMDDDNREAISSLETKIDLLLLLVGKGIQGLEPLPPCYSCSLGAEDLYWEAASSAGFPHENGPVCVALFLRPRIAMPLFLPGTLQMSVTQPEASAETLFRYHLHFQLDARVQESLDRLIFRHHRRSIARQKDHHHFSAE
ncbi:PilZ domain-containing protein [Acidithiobacillus sp.]|uniref:PilZ domain-containing protein n=1 Tax=Acidithiobacillus sp. TaxID=1872118 RepID=UPI0026367A52|nr:PilZ domain-containing protein [Acidithiobacillus sp.]MDD2748479.1 PilZ domain-containing protein [Acidithiobacillus sp.]MDD5278238.1 PilZ domain-containing protein [Acidithiobacillus sp.]